MSAEPSASMARFPRALAVRFRTVSRATFLFKISTEAFKGRVIFMLIIADFLHYKTPLT